MWSTLAIRGCTPHSNGTMECDGYDEHGNDTLAMVIIVMLPNHTSHVWHRLDANLEMNSYN